MHQRLVQALLLIILVQWCLLTFLLYQHHEGDVDNKAQVSSRPQKTALLQDFGAPTVSNTTAWTGVAVTLALRAPKWFHRRYTVMMNNILANTPETWAVQVFYRPEWWKDEIMSRHRGMQRLIQNQRVILTPLPKAFWNSKPKDVYKDTWIWEHMVADRVLMFTGNGMLCAHSIASWDDFEGLDYVGAPWRRGVGGDGSTHSLRNRKAVLEAIPQYDKKDNGPEHTVLVDTLLRLNKERQGRFRLATVNDTLKFGGTSMLVDTNATTSLDADYEQKGPPLIVSGTQAHLPWHVREALLGICPEWKLIFPSLHDPNCFGANPNAEKCASSICALQPNRTKQGC